MPKAFIVASINVTDPDGYEGRQKARPTPTLGGAELVISIGDAVAAQ